MSKEAQSHMPIAQIHMPVTQTPADVKNNKPNGNTTGTLPTAPSAQPKSNTSSKISQRKDSHVRQFFRHFRPASQITLTWLLWLLSCLSFSMTVYYAFGTSVLVRSPLVTNSTSNTILVIRTLSALTELLMIGLVAACFERVKWMLVASKIGIPILDFLTLSEGTGAAGFLTISLSRVKSIKSSRIWTLVR
jgi:hypothetical protein